MSDCLNICYENIILKVALVSVSKFPKLNMTLMSKTSLYAGCYQENFFLLYRFRHKNNCVI